MAKRRAIAHAVRQREHKGSSEGSEGSVTDVSLCVASVLTQKQKEEVCMLEDALADDSVLRAKAQSMAEEIKSDKTLHRAHRRYSDQFRTIALDRLTKEMQKNRSIRLVHRFAQDNTDIQNTMAEWRRVLVAAFEDIVEIRDIDRRSAYKELELADAGICREEVRVDEEDTEKEQKE